MTFGDKLISLRKKSKMTQDESADELGVTRQTVSNWELNQTKPDMEQLKGLSKLYKISLDELVDNNIKETLTEKVSNVEKLTGLIYKILIGILILFGIFIIVGVGGMVLFRFAKTETLWSETILSCTLNNEKYNISIKNTGSNYVEVSGDINILKPLDLQEYQYQYEAIDEITNYFEIKGGTCE